MPAVMEAIDHMSSEERIKTMEYLWAAMTAAALSRRALKKRCACSMKTRPTSKGVMKNGSYA